MKSLKQKKTSNTIPVPVINRLNNIYSILESIEYNETDTISSSKIGERIGASSHNIRKDLGYLKETGAIGSGYNITTLKEEIETFLGLNNEVKSCIVGLGSLGTAIIKNNNLIKSNYKISAGFDSSINRIETIVTDVPLFPTHELPDVIKSQNIRLAIISVPADSAEGTFKKLINSGIKGIINFSSAVLATKRKDIFIKNIDLIGEFRFLSAMINLQNSENTEPVNQNGK